MFNNFKYLYNNIDEKTRKRLIIYFFIGLLSPVMSLYGISGILPILNSIMNGTAGIKEAYISIAIAFFMILASAFELYNNYISSGIIFDGSHYLSIKIFELTLKQDLLTHNSKSKIQEHTLVRNDTKKCIEYLLSSITIISNMIILSFFFVALLYYDGIVGLLLSILIIVQIIVIFIANRNRIKIFGEKLRKTDIETSEKVSIVYGAYKEIKNVNKPMVFTNRYIKKNLEYIKIAKIYENMKAFVTVILKNSIFIIMYFLLAFMIFFKFNMLPYIAKTIVTIMLIIRAIPLGNKIVASLNTIKSVDTSVDLIRNSLELKNIISNEERNEKKLRRKELILDDGIKIRDLCFAYPNGKMIYNNASIDMPKGKVVAITGNSGIGKTTFLDILLGYLKPNSGSIYIGDYDYINKTDKDGPCILNLGSVIYYIPQLVYMVGCTVRENVAFYEEENIDDDKVVECLKKASVYEDVMNMPDGINTIVGSGGVIISGGQRQRIAIARALYKGFKILIMDEATASLDEDTENKIMEYIHSIKKDKIILMVSHHTQVVEKCDIVYKVKNGKFVKEK